MKNEIDEDFKEVIEQIKSAVKEYIMILIEREYPKKSREFINQIMGERIQGKITRDVAYDIIETIYQNNIELKKAICDQIETKIILEQNITKKK